MLARGASRTDWARVRGMTDELEASIAADPDDVHAPLCTIHRWRDLTVWRRYGRWRRLVQRSDANFPTRCCALLPALQRSSYEPRWASRRFRFRRNRDFDHHLIDHRAL
jgi:hypothetical protein